MVTERRDFPIEDLLVALRTLEMSVHNGGKAHIFGAAEDVIALTVAVKVALVVDETTRDSLDVAETLLNLGFTSLALAEIRRVLLRQRGT